MAKKTIKSDELIDLINNDDKVLSAIMLRIEDKLTVLMEKVLDKYTAALMPKIESMINEKVDKRSSDQNSVNTGLAKETLKLNTKINDLETQLRQGNLMIYGLRGKPSATSEENEPINLALALFNNEMSVEVRHKDISKAYFLPSKDAERRPMLIQFNNPRVRGNILLARKALKTDSDDKKSRIYINEHLTSLNATLFTEARKLVKEKSLHSTWTRDGRIYIKRSESNTERPTRITSLNDLHPP